MTTISKEALKSALIELAQSDRVFFASLIAGLMAEAGPAKVAESDNPITPAATGTKITPPYRKNTNALRKKYAMDKTVLLRLQDLFADAPPAEELLQASNR